MTPTDDIIAGMLALLVGGLLGMVFFGGLWWTVQKSLSSPHPALWLLGSLLIRTGITLAGFYAVSAGAWQRLLLCLLGFVLARQMVIRLSPALPSILERPDAP
ncbi:MAG: ATP synthase subunit I [Methylovulum sp.]|nr:ATP synthase subunit I [Methylovulum sp.]